LHSLTDKISNSIESHTRVTRQTFHAVGWTQKYSEPVEIIYS